jgi:hypothetical protein
MFVLLVMHTILHFKQFHVLRGKIEILYVYLFNLLFLILSLIKT